MFFKFKKKEDNYFNNIYEYDDLHNDIKNKLTRQEYDYFTTIFGFESEKLIDKQLQIYFPHSQLNYKFYDIILHNEFKASNYKFIITGIIDLEDLNNMLNHKLSTLQILIYKENNYTCEIKYNNGYQFNNEIIQLLGDEIEDKITNICDDIAKQLLILDRKIWIEVEKNII